MTRAAPGSPGSVPGWLLGAIGLAIACGRGAPVAPANTAREGISIALYHAGDGSGYAMIDDRRWSEVTGDALVLDHVDPGADLSSLVIEPLAGGALDVGACLRDRIPAPPPIAVADAEPAVASGPSGPSGKRAFSPVLRCAVRGARGRYLVRVLYVSPALGYRAQHDLAMTAPDRVTVASRFAIVTPAWQARAEVTLFDGMPGTEAPPREVARGTILLDGGTAVIAVPPRDASAELRRVYNGAVPDDDDDASDHASDHASQPARVTIGQVLASLKDREDQQAVWVWLELAGPALAPGPVRVHLEIAGEATRDLVVPAAGRRGAAAALRLPLWIDDQLRGKRDRGTGAPDGDTGTDRLAVSIANTGAVTRDVWIEETLRPGRRRPIVHAWPGEPTLGKRRVRVKLTVPGGKIERAGFEIIYEP